MTNYPLLILALLALVYGIYGIVIALHILFGGYRQLDLFSSIGLALVRIVKGKQVEKKTRKTFFNERRFKLRAQYYLFVGITCVLMFIYAIAKLLNL